VKKKNEEGHDSDGNSLPDDDDDLLPTGSASRPGTAGTAGTEGSDAGSLGSARDDAAAQAFAIGDEVVLNKRLKKKKVIGDVLLPSQLCTVTYGPDDKGDMKIERKSDGKVLRYVRPKDIEHTRAATGSPGLNGPVNGPERQGRASRGSGRFSAGSNGIASVQEAMDEALAEVGADGKSPSSSAAGRVTAGGLIVDGKPLTSGILDKRGMLLKIRPSTMAATVKVEPETVGMRLFCFPWEGANTGIFEHFSHLVKTALVVAVQYPGRMNRAKEMPRDDVRFLARGAVEAMRGQKLLDTPYAFLGHGVGALIAYECARIIRNDLKSAGVKPPALFIAVQAEGPQAFDDDHGGEALHEEPDDVLSQHVLTLERGCLPAEVTEQPALFALALPLFRNDTKAYETFRYESDWPFNATPFYVLLGEYDGRYGRDTVQLWDQETTKEFELRILPSGAREMFRDPILTAETAAWVDSKIDFELKRPIDPDAGLLSDPNAV
jgi:surfactin synthase thioesterase subunit